MSSIDYDKVRQITRFHESQTHLLDTPPRHQRFIWLVQDYLAEGIEELPDGTRQKVVIRVEKKDDYWEFMTFNPPLKYNGDWPVRNVRKIITDQAQPSSLMERKPFSYEGETIVLGKYDCQHRWTLLPEDNRTQPPQYGLLPHDPAEVEFQKWQEGTRHLQHLPFARTVVRCGVIGFPVGEPGDHIWTIPQNWQPGEGIILLDARTVRQIFTIYPGQAAQGS